MLEGYAERRTLPDVNLLDDFIATREVAFGLWFAGMAQVNPGFARDLDKVMAATHDALDRLL